MISLTAAASVARVFLLCIRSFRRVCRRPRLIVVVHLCNACICCTWLTASFFYALNFCYILHPFITGHPFYCYSHGECYALESFRSFYYIPRDAMRKRSLCCCPVSVCPSVTFVYCIQTAEDIVKLPSSSPIILVF